MDRQADNGHDPYTLSGGGERVRSDINSWVVNNTSL